MARKLQITILAGVTALILLAVAVYLWDSSSEGKIANGVTVDGIDLGGMDAEQAARQLNASLIEPLQHNVVVLYGDQKYKLKWEDLKIATDVDGIVDEALQVSQEGGIISRTLRRLGGNEVDHAIAPQITYSRARVDEFVNAVAGNLDRAPVDASVEPTASTIEPVRSENGRQVEVDKLRAAVEKALQSPTDRRVEPLVDKVKPEVTTAQLADKYPTYITVDRSNFQLRLYKNLELAKTYTVALGQLGFDTPAGLYHIQSKQVDPVWSVPNSDWAGDLAGETIPPGPDNPLKARWMGIYDGAGIHGTSDEGSLGSAASHGCIRMSVPDVIDLYDRVPTGTPIYIA